MGFRYSAQHEARRCKVCGWVRNESDGSVTTEFEGSEDACEKFLAWLRRGPPGAHVSNVQTRKMPFQGFYKSFTIEF